MHKSSYQKMEAFRRRFLSGREAEPLRILDVGSQDVNGCYRPIFDAPAWTPTSSSVPAAAGAPSAGRQSASAHFAGRFARRLAWLA